MCHRQAPGEHSRASAVEHLQLCDGDSVAEIGCGTGISLPYLADAVGPSGRVYGVDLSPGMLQRAQARCARQSGQWAATFTYPTGAPEALDLAKKILLDCASSVPDTITVPTLAITEDNAKELNAKLKF